MDLNQIWNHPSFRKGVWTKPATLLGFKKRILKQIIRIFEEALLSIHLRFDFRTNIGDRKSKLEVPTNASKDKSLLEKMLYASSIGACVLNFRCLSERGTVEKEARSATGSSISVHTAELQRRSSRIRNRSQTEFGSSSEARAELQLTPDRHKQLVCTHHFEPACVQALSFNVELVELVNGDLEVVTKVVEIQKEVWKRARWRRPSEGRGVPRRAKFLSAKYAACGGAERRCVCARRRAKGARRRAVWRSAARVVSRPVARSFLEPKPHVRSSAVCPGSAC